MYKPVSWIDCGLLRIGMLTGLERAGRLALGGVPPSPTSIASKSDSDSGPLQ